MEIKVKKLNEKAVLPHIASSGAAAADLHALLDNPLTIKAGERALVPTGISIELPGNEYVALICARSGMAFKRGLALANGIGVIDSDYRGELLVAMINTGNEDQTIEPGDRIAQLMVLPVVTPVYTEVSEIGETERGAGGFGSTGKA